MVSLQPKLNLRVSQRQILTPGLMQMVSVLALNKIELKDMIQTEIVENPVLEELEEAVPLLDHVAGREADREVAPVTATEDVERPDPVDPFEEIDFGSYFQDYLDPGFRSPQSFEMTEKPSIENFLSTPGSLIDHLEWQVGSLSLDPLLRAAVDYILGNLDEDGRCITSEDDLHSGWLRELCSNLQPALAPARPGHAGMPSVTGALDPSQRTAPFDAVASAVSANARAASLNAALNDGREEDPATPRVPDAEALFARALQIVRSLDPIGVGASDLRDCLLLQIAHCERVFQDSSWKKAGGAAGVQERMNTFAVAHRIVDTCLPLLHKRDLRELGKAAQATPQQIAGALEFIRTLDPHPGQRFQQSEARLIEPDVSFVKRDDVFIAVMEDESLPTLRLNRDYRKLLHNGEAGKDVKDYVKERYRSALQLMRNIEQRKNTILRTCEVIVRRQQEFLEHGVQALKPMMIKDVAEEIGVHPSTVSRAVSNKYAHTPQGVFELRFFFSEGVNGPEGSGTPLLLLKRRVKKLIEDEDPRKPLTDDHITQLLQKEGIDVTRRTVAKYREDMRIPSTHQRRVRG
ncbi:RNA polymerase factor sigma-54 [Acidipila sp. EB88]|uniref:RNA polymerase factor sigma-54 n=1 Tax=Acidipila sp. EB88 TaxID=2305226 RepID=UPI000F5FDF29|nr:RNA polymerase factor sigma-54 [Acidipila sp. EB88]RRA49213.1 RNA polymerase sigma-54 factor [Acidipila sp. EB88]